MHDDLEFHYVVSCRNGFWELVAEDDFMPDGTIYDWDEKRWIVAPDSTEDGSVEDIDIEQYRVLRYALSLLNRKEI